MAPLLHLRDICLTFGGTPLLTGADLVVGQGERLCLVGRNGSGKSTLLKIAAGHMEPDSGTRFLQPSTTIRYLPQEPEFAGFATAGAFVEAGLAPGDDPSRAPYFLRALGLTGAESTDRLSGGEARRAALARVLAPSPDILLLDEPTNHLDLPAIEWLETELAAMRGALVLISHDRRFLSSLSRKTLWLDRGETRLLDRDFAEFEAWRDEVIEQEERDQHKLDRKILRELDWVRYGVSGRRKRNQKRMADLGELRRKRKEQRGAVGNVRMSTNDAAESGTRVIEAKAISKSFEGSTVVREFSTRILRRDRIGVVGANGAGKTTLLRMLIGRLAPDSGEVVLGAKLLIASLDQNRASLDPDLRLSDVLTGGGGDTVTIGGQVRHVASYMKDFLFMPEQARTPVRVLSGGERGRLLLAKALATPSNLLVLDEPTNDLDLETLDLLQEMLADYPGTILIVSHDRDFLDRVVTATVVAEGDGKFVEYAGGYSDMVAQRGAGVTKKAAPVAVRPPVPVKDKERAPAAPRRLSFKDKHALQELPARIAKLEAEIAGLLKELDDPSVFQRDQTRFAARVSRLGAAQTELSVLEDRWIELELLRQELEGPR